MKQISIIRILTAIGGVAVVALSWAYVAGGMAPKIESNYQDIKRNETRIEKLDETKLDNRRFNDFMESNKEQHKATQKLLQDVINRL